MQMESNMKTAFFQSTDFTYFVEVTKVDAIKDSLSLKITSQWQSAKKPDEEQTQLQVTCTKTDLLKLSNLIETAVSNG
jgi:GTP-binding protein EngB required for normal cell division